MKIHNFSAGPCILPQEVFEQASQSVLNYQNTGLSILEISHRSKHFVDIMEESRSLVLELLQLEGKGYKVLFLQGGASTQFLMVAYNFLNRAAGYIDTGSWSTKAIKEAAFFGETLTIASSKSQNYNHIPKNYTVPEQLDYLHLTSNNTIFGTQIKNFPSTPHPLICDMSSDIFSRELDFSKFDLIYAGAQKNMGPAGTTLVVIREELLDRVERKVPSMLNYKIHISKSSMFNTPPVFAVYTSLLTLRWLKQLGGISSIEERNEKKAILIYSEIDVNPLFQGIAKEEDRSIMNATFRLIDEDLSETFETMCKEAGISGVTGHRSVGGYRASMYNAMTKNNVATLVDVMDDLEQKA